MVCVPKWPHPPNLLSTEEEREGRQDCKTPLLERRIKDWIEENLKDAFIMQEAVSITHGWPYQSRYLQKPLWTASSLVKIWQSWSAKTNQLSSVSVAAESSSASTRGWRNWVFNTYTHMTHAVKLQFFFNNLTASCGWTFSAKIQNPPIQRVVYSFVFLILYSNC